MAAWILKGRLDIRPEAGGEREVSVMVRRFRQILGDAGKANYAGGTLAVIVQVDAEEREDAAARAVTLVYDALDRAGLPWNVVSWQERTVEEIPEAS